jgi:hypothetical protein
MIKHLITYFSAPCYAVSCPRSIGLSVPYNFDLSGGIVVRQLYLIYKDNSSVRNSAV